MCNVSVEAEVMIDQISTVDRWHPDIWHMLALTHDCFPTVAESTQALDAGQGYTRIWIFRNTRNRKCEGRHGKVTHEVSETIQPRICTGIVQHASTKPRKQKKYHTNRMNVQLRGHPSFFLEAKSQPMRTL